MGSGAHLSVCLSSFVLHSSLCCIHFSPSTRQSHQLTNISYFSKTFPDSTSPFSYHPPVNSKILERPAYRQFSSFFYSSFWPEFYLIYSTDIVLSSVTPSSKIQWLLCCLHLTWSLSSFLPNWVLLKILPLLVSPPPRAAASQSHWLAPASSSAGTLDVI